MARLSLPEALARLPGSVDRASVESIAATSQHDVFRLTIAARHAVLRIADRGSDLSVALRAQRQAAAAGLAPDVLLAAPDAGLLLTAFVPGQTLAAAGDRLESTIDAVGRLLGQVHALSPLGTPLNLQAAADEYVQLCQPPLRHRANTIRDELMTRLERRAAGPLVPCHNDPVADNILVGASTMLLDWEYAADNDPMFDLAVVSVHHALSVTARERLLHSYDPFAVAVNRTRLEEWESIYRCVDWLWSAAHKPVSA